MERRQFPGAAPTALANTRVKWLWSAKPHVAAMSDSGIAVSRYRAATPWPFRHDAGSAIDAAVCRSSGGRRVRNGRAKARIAAQARQARSRRRDARRASPWRGVPAKRRARLLERLHPHPAIVPGDMRGSGERDVVDEQLARLPRTLEGRHQRHAEVIDRAVVDSAFMRIVEFPDPGPAGIVGQCIEGSARQMKVKSYERIVDMDDGLRPEVIDRDLRRIGELARSAPKSRAKASP